MPEPTTRRSARLAAKKQAAPSFANCPQLVLSAIHDILLHEDDDEDGFCRFPATRDAACFRATCKAFYDAVGPIPSTLKLSFHDPLSHKATHSLAFMLSRPIAARTHLSLRLCMQNSKVATRKVSRAVLGDESDQPWATPLAALAERVKSLEMPSFFINPALAAVCKALPSLKELVLHVASETLMASLSLSDSDEETDDCETALLGQSKLESLTLSVPSGWSPFYFSEDEPLLDLSTLPAFHTLVLRGPFVKLDIEDDDVPFLLPPQAKVIIDPGLRGKRPTRWARSLTIYDRFDAMPGSAVPGVEEYKEEDEDMRQHHINKFRSKIIELVCSQHPHEIGLDGYAEGFLYDGNLIPQMTKQGIEGQSFMLEHVFSVGYIAELVFKSYERWKEDMWWDSDYGLWEECGCC